MFAAADNDVHAWSAPSGVRPSIEKFSRVYLHEANIQRMPCIETVPDDLGCLAVILPVKRFAGRVVSESLKDQSDSPP
nr:hypothetical protein K4M19_00142 [Agrobacterium fabrum]